MKAFVFTPISFSLSLSDERRQDKHYDGSGNHAYDRPDVSSFSRSHDGLPQSHFTLVEEFLDHLFGYCIGII